MHSKRGTVYLVGAGPGDPDLISVKGLKAIEKADVILYDALVNDLLLVNAKRDCVLVYVGKRSGIHAFQQVLINDMLVEYANKYENVVRLKGGDSFVFGRGHEELAHIEEHEINVEVIPGITSAISIPALNGIPVTKRGINESFWVVTGTTIHENMSSDLKLAAQSSATVVILMGMKRLRDIVQVFKKHRGENEAIAIIQNGSRKNEKKAFGSLEAIEQLVNEHKIGSPAIIIIGEVVRDAGKLSNNCLYRLILQSN